MKILRIFHRIVRQIILFIPYTLNVFEIHLIPLNFLIIDHVPLMINDYQTFLIINT